MCVGSPTAGAWSSFQRRPDDEFETDRYIKWSKTLGEQVEHLGEQVQHLANQHASDQQGYVKWSKYMSEQQGILNAHVETLTKAYNELARLLDEG